MINSLVGLGAVDWNKSAAWAAWLSDALILAPLLYYFVVRVFKYITHWVLNKSSNGLTIAIHNNTRSSLFILCARLTIKGKPAKDIDFSSFKCIKPDELINIPIDYIKYEISSAEHVSLYINFAGKVLAKKIKVK